MDERSETAAPAAHCEHTVDIVELGQRGDGIGWDHGSKLFIPFTLPGERVRAVHGSERPLVHELLQQSPERIAAFCPYFGSCGGCALQHLAKPAYEEWKRSLLVAALLRVGIDVPVAPLVDAQGAGRRRVTLHARRNLSQVGRSSLVVGFMEARSHQVVDIAACPVLDPALATIFDAARSIALAVGVAEKPLDLLCTATETGIDVDLRGCGALDHRVIGKLVAVARDLGLARISNHGVVIVQVEQPFSRIGNAQVALPPGAFLQPTVVGETILANEVVDALSDARHTADLFCGIGTFALKLAARSDVSGYDMSPSATEAMETAAKRASGLRQVKGVARDLFRRPLLPDELKPFDAICLDPPRAGAEAQIREIAASTIGRVVSVSCDVTSFARDAALLLAAGFAPDRPILPVDQFRYTPHLEIVASFRRDPPKRKRRLLG